MTRVVISGAGGRLGARILARALEAKDLTVVTALVRPGSKLDGHTLAPGLVASSDATAIVTGTVLIEAASKAAALEHVQRAAAVGAPALVATTGFSSEERGKLEAWAQKIPVLIAPNLSLGVAVLLDLAARASAALPDYHLELVELHHAKKKDAPSGTAWAIARAAAEARGLDAEREAIVARSGDVGVRGEKEIGMMSIRGGDIVGEHTLYLIGPNERVELTHRASSRDVFASGAVAAARFLGAPKRAPGLYAMKDVLA